MISIEDLVRWRRRNEVLVDRVAETRLPTSHGDFTAYGYQISVDESEHVALVYGDITGPEPVLDPGALRVPDRRRLQQRPVRLRTAAQRGDGHASSTEGRGVVVYLRGHEGRGIGLVAKLQAYQLQDGGRDTVDANLDLGLPADARHYGAATQILKDLGVSTVRLMTNNPDKVTNLQEYGITVAERVPLTPHPNDHNLAYLLTKRDRMGHVLPDLEALDPAEAHSERRRRSDGRAVRRERSSGRCRGGELAHPGDGRPARRRRPGLCRPPGRGHGRPGAGHLRAPGRRVRARAAGVRRRRGAGRGHPRRHAALRLRLLGRHRRPDPGRARPHGRGRVRRTHLRHRAAGARPGGARGLQARTRATRPPRPRWPPPERSARSPRPRSDACDSATARTHSGVVVRA